MPCIQAWCDFLSSWNRFTQTTNKRDYLTKTVFVAPALSVRDIGVRFSVRPSGRPSVRLPGHNLRRPWLLSPFKWRFLWNHCVYEFQISHAAWSDCKASDLQKSACMVENPRWPPILKIAKPLKSTFSPEWLGIFGWNFVCIISGTLVISGIKMNKICCGIRSQWPFENLRRP